MTTDDEELGYLFERGCGKYLKLIPGNARFHSSAEDATPIKKSVFDDEIERARLLDHHNVDWYSSTIVFKPIKPENAPRQGM